MLITISPYLVGCVFLCAEEIYSSTLMAWIKLCPIFCPQLLHWNFHHKFPHPTLEAQHWGTSQCTLDLPQNSETNFNQVGLPSS